jgi:hypothetical protein
LIYEAMRGLGMNAEILGCIQDAQKVLAFDLPEAECQAVLLFRSFMTIPQPQFITEWRSSPQDEKWYVRLVDGLNWAD